MIFRHWGLVMVRYLVPKTETEQYTNHSIQMVPNLLGKQYLILTCISRYLRSRFLTNKGRASWITQRTNLVICSTMIHRTQTFGWMQSMILRVRWKANLRNNFLMSSRS